MEKVWHRRDLAETQKSQLLSAGRAEKNYFITTRPAALCKGCSAEKGKDCGQVRNYFACPHKEFLLPGIFVILGWKPGSKMYARYGIVDRNDMNDALLRSEQWEQAQRDARTEMETKWRQSDVSGQEVRPN